MIGIGIAFAILLDATVIRGLLVPALMKLMGDWNWWAPRVLQRFSIKH
jgi:RND superfamily putative drug exporter